ncbi:MAG: PfkB family carbohydrate kinase [Bifidobacteriaceae bacterium]|nr:PfkB family carbohydrate kinase [Bifidobacteriaceae bacterium]
MNGVVQTRALVIGEALIDVVPRAGASPLELPGGSPLNVAIGLGRLGRLVDLETWIAPDPHGWAIQQHLAESHVHLAAGSLDARFTPTAKVEFNPSGGARYVFDLEWDFTPPQSLGDIAVLHTGSLATAVEPGGAKLATFFGSLKNTLDAVPTLTFDPNLRPAVTPDPETIRPRVEALAAVADVVKVSDEDLAFLYPERDPLDVIGGWAEQGAALAVLTSGQAGATAVAGAVSVNAPAKAVDAVDTVGAGDAFMSGLIDGLWTEGLIGAGARPALRSISETQLVRVVDRARTVAAAVVGRAGANPPWARELA